MGRCRFINRCSSRWCRSVNRCSSSWCRPVNRCSNNRCREVRGKAALLNHARTLLHLRAEQLCEARRVEAGGEQPGIADIFVVTEYSDTEQAESSETGE